MGYLIATINGEKFFYGGYDPLGWHRVYTEDNLYHIENPKEFLPTYADCLRIYKRKKAWKKYDY